MVWGREEETRLNRIQIRQYNYNYSTTEHLLAKVHIAYTICSIHCSYCLRKDTTIHDMT